MTARYNPVMPLRPDVPAARAAVQPDGLVELGGDWQITAARPSWRKLLAGRNPPGLRIVLTEGTIWDSSLLLFIDEVRRWAHGAGVPCDIEALPEKMRAMARELAATHDAGSPVDRAENPLAMIGRAALDVGGKTRQIVHFVGSCVLGAYGVVRHPTRFRWRDCLIEMQQCGAMALPIVSLISLLVGLIMAYQAAVQLRQFGADIYVADLVGLSVVREMGAMMAGIILAGRTGAAFAATLANMKANEEIDALETLGVPAVEFLVMPRLLALGLMMPLLALYADLLGVLGGMFVSLTILGIPPSAYWIETKGVVDLSDVSTGLIKSVAFGLLVGLSGCLRGLQAERSSSGVGRAATSAVVTGILLIIVADAVFAVIFNILHL